MSKHVFDKDAWARMDIFNQMGNVGSEVGRALNAKKNGKTDWMEGAFYRGLDLIDATTEQLVKNKSPRLKEVLYAREFFVAAITTDNADPKLENYFMQFAYAARKNR